MQFIKTEAGHAAFKARSDLFSVRQRSAYLLFDGIKSVEQILKLTAALGITQADVDALAEHGFIEQVNAVVAPPTTAALAATPAPAATLASILKGAPEASALISSSGAVGAAMAQPNVPTQQERFAKAWPLATQLTAGLGIRGFRLNLSIEKAAGYQDLLLLLPKIQDAVGVEKCAALERALKS